MRSLALLCVIMAAAACSPSEQTAPATTDPPTPTTTAPDPTTTTVPPEFAVSSPAFADGEPIPATFTCDGDDISPQLNVAGIPEGTASLAVIVDDPDAPLGTWTHWVEFDIPVGPGSFELAEDVEGPGVPGVNSWNLEGYMGPCPPGGEEHTYLFQIYAVETNLGLPAGVDVEAVVDALEGNVVDMVETTGTYSR